MQRLLLRFCPACVVWLTALLWAGPAMAHVVSVVSSDRSAAFQEATESLLLELQRNGVARSDIRLLTSAELVDSAAALEDCRLVITLGTDALRQVATRNLHTAVLAGLIPRLGFERVLRDTNRKAAGNMAALYLDQPFGRQLDLLRLALPQVHRIGVLWGPESVSQQGLLAGAMQGRGLEISEGVYTEGQPLIGMLRSALNEADVLLAVADSTVYNTASASNILLTSYRAKTPVMAFSPAYVKAGALLSVHSTASQAGTQIGTMASHFLQLGNLPASQYPSDFSISVNPYVARSLGLSLDADSLLERLRKLEKRP
jgi:ABC-type uncharacterized transport system substrate-binding protein